MTFFFKVVDCMSYEPEFLVAYFPEDQLEQALACAKERVTAGCGDYVALVRCAFGKDAARPHLVWQAEIQHQDTDLATPGEGKEAVEDDRLM